MPAKRTGRPPGTQNHNMVPKCDHQFIFLRSEETNIGYDRAPKYLIRDVYFCQHCLIYRKLDVRHEVPSSAEFGKRVITERLL